MFKKVLKGIAIGSAALTLAVSAQAAEINVNLYGASAQFEFWTAAAPEFLADTGCLPSDVFHSKKTKIAGRDTGIAVCRGDVAVPGLATGTGGGINGTDGDTVYIRYTTNASYDGIRAVTLDSAYDPDASHGCTYATRYQADEAQVTWGALGSTAGVVSGLKCQPVHIGASDVAATTFRQESHGSELGPLTSDWVDQSISFPGDLQDPSTLGFRVDRPIVVPFAFFANMDSTDSTTPGANAVPYDNMTRLMAVSIFSGQVANWNELDGTTDLPVTVCMRHAGSGTVATLNAAVMRGDNNLVIEEVTYEDALDYGEPAIYFTKGSSDMMKCVKNAPGSVGYADADKCTGTACASSYKAKVMTYQGVAANSANIQNGLYDFWSAQWLYSNQSPTSETGIMIDKLAAYSSDQSKLPASKSAYWSAQSAMKYEKLSDFQYPVKK